MQDIGGNLVISIIGSIIGGIIIGIILGAVAHANAFLGIGKRLWRFKKPEAIYMIIASPATINTGLYNRPMTAEGEMRAMALAIKSISRAYRGKLNVNNILLSTDRLQDRYDCDLLLLGGPKNNKITEDFFSKVDGKQPVVQTEDCIIWRKKESSDKWVDTGRQTFQSTFQNNNVTTDYGVVIAMRSPFNSDRRLVLLSGTHSFGTIAAARFFTENMQSGWKALRWWVWSLRKHNFALVIKTNVEHGYVSKPEVETKDKWK